MKHTLAVIRSQIVNAYKQGKDNADRSIGNRQLNQRIIDVRNTLIFEHYKFFKTIDPSWIQWIDIPVSKEQNATGYRIVSTDDIPQILSLGDSDAGFWQVKPIGLVFDKLKSFILKPASQLETIRNGKYTSHMNFAARENNRLIIISKSKNIGNVLMGAVLSNPEDDPNFTENSDFPISAELIDELIKRVANFDLNLIAGLNNDKNNNSSEEINVRKTPTGQQ